MREKYVLHVEYYTGVRPPGGGVQVVQRGSSERQNLVISTLQGQ